MLCSSANELQQNSNASSREEYTPYQDIGLNLSQWTMAYNSVERTHGAYNVTWIEVPYLLNLAIQSECDKCIRQCCNVLTMLPVFHCSLIKLLYRCTFMAHCMARVPPFITKANTWNCGTSCSINCDWLFHCKSLLKEYEYSVIQSVLMTKFRTDFTSLAWSFCHWVADVPRRETSPSGNQQGERSVFQAG